MTRVSEHMIDCALDQLDAEWRKLRAGDADATHREAMRRILEAAMRAWAADEHTRLSGEIEAGT